MLLKRAQNIWQIWCRHGCPGTVDFILKQTEKRNSDARDLCGKWNRAHKCNKLTFNFWEIEEMYYKLGIPFASKKSDLILQRANLDRNNYFTMEDYVKVYCEEMQR